MVRFGHSGEQRRRGQGSATIPEAEIRQIVEVNLLAPILLIRAALPLLRASGDGLIVAVTAPAIGIPFYATYNASKAGLDRFTEALRRELMGEGVAVLTVDPSGVDTPMMSTSDLGKAMGSELRPASFVGTGVVKAIRDGERTLSLCEGATLRMLALDRSNPAELDKHVAQMRGGLAQATRNHRAL